MQDAHASTLATITPPSHGKPSQRHPDVDAAIEHAKQFLPTQGPISIFVHHNTLHSLEHLPFEQAVIQGGRRYGCQPYLSEDRYRQELRRTRISVDDLRQVLMDDLADDADLLVASFGTRYTLRLAMLQMNLHAAPEAELQWLLTESDLLKRFRREVSETRREQTIAATRTWMTRHRESNQPSDADAIVLQRHGKPIQSWDDDAWEAFTLETLWQVCRDGIETVDASTHPDVGTQTLEQSLRHICGVDVHETVNEVLIRFCGGYLDQGFADWTLPDRKLGFAKSFAKLFTHRFAILPTWMDGLRGELSAIVEHPFDALGSIEDSLAALGVGAADVEETLTQSLLALRGWAGMIWQTESNAPHLPEPIPAGSLNDYLAIRLILQRHAIADVGRQNFATTDLAEIRRCIEAAAVKRSAHAGPSIDERTYTIFQLAQAGGWTPEHLLSMSNQQWNCLVREIEMFDSIQRRRIFHRAYERHYQTAALDAIAIHSSRRQTHLAQGKQTQPDYLAIFCIDDREESFRRHLEEVDPRCRTASAAGFFAVAMYYQGADHAHYRPLCPAIVTPKHYVREEPTFSTVTESEKRAQRRRRIGHVTHQVHAHSRTMIGGWITGLFGAVATFPLVARIMAPHLTARIRESVGTFVKPPATELHLERSAPEPGQDPQSLGYSVEEMADIVVRILQDIGVVENFPRIVVFFGHGSSSLNNPHESAYNCGACSGGRGGPNARAFANMANDPRVRRLTARRGVQIPEEVRFVGAFHNTCDDDVEYYDLDLLPRTHRDLFRRIETSVNATRGRNAHERSRRFDSAALDMTPAEALLHVEQRAEDLSQARPEYNHATNALVTVGRRDWTRGLFMDRRVFLTEYDPAVDDENVTVLRRILQAAIPVCAGISLEYYFSSVDVEGYGCGSKLPHNVAAMIGVMTGAASDLRPGLSQQMIEIHEPMRILFVIETTPERMNKIIAENEGIARLIQGDWVQIALIHPETSSIVRYVDGRYEPYVRSGSELPMAESSMDWYRGNRDHLGFASIVDKLTSDKTTRQT